MNETSLSQQQVPKTPEGMSNYEVLKISLVLLGIRYLAKPEQVKQFSNTIGGEVMQSPHMVFSLPQGQPEIITRCEVPKERTVLELQRNRTIIERSFPTKEDIKRFAEVASLAAQMSDFSETTIPQSYGFNVESVYQQHSGVNALNYLGHRMFSDPVTASDDWELFGGVANLTYDSPDGRWNFKAEPRFNELETDKVFLQLNLHQEQPQKIPNQTDIIESVNNVWKKMHTLAVTIDGGE